MEDAGQLQAVDMQLSSSAACMHGDSASEHPRLDTDEPPSRRARVHSTGRLSDQHQQQHYTGKTWARHRSLLAAMPAAAAEQRAAAAAGVRQVTSHLGAYQAQAEQQLACRVAYRVTRA